MLRDRRGATALEFALVAAPMMVLIFGLVEVSLQLAGAVALDYGALRASRFASTGGAPSMPGAPACRSAAIPWIITSITGGFLRAENLSVTAASHDGYAAIEAGLPGTSGPGGGGQIVSYTITYRQSFITEIFLPLLTGVSYFDHQATIIVRNEPFSNANC